MASLSSGKVLVTGLQGFTGRYIEEALRSGGYAVYGLSSGKSGNFPESQVDIRDAKAVTEQVNAIAPDYVIHLAAISFVEHGDMTEIYDVNVKGTLNLVEALKNSPKPVRKLLFASSGNIYGGAASNQSLCEDTELRPLNHYSISKITAEYLVRLGAERVPFVIARPFNYTGIGQSRNFVVPKLVEAFRRRQSEILLGNIDTVRDFSDVRWVAAVYRSLIESDLSYETVNVCSGQGVRIREILAGLASLSGHEIQVRTDELLLRAQEIQSLVGSPQKLEHMITVPRRPAFTETLAWMYEATA